MQHPPASEPSAASSSGPSPASASSVASGPPVGSATSLSSITSWYTSSDLDMVQRVTRPSEDTEVNFKSFSLRSCGCHFTCHTGSVCFPVFTSHCRMGRFILLRTSYTSTEPSYRPTASKLECCGWKSRHITPLSVVNAYSGWLGFFSE